MASILGCQKFPIFGRSAAAGGVVAVEGNADYFVLEAECEEYLRKIRGQRDDSLYVLGLWGGGWVLIGRGVKEYHARGHPAENQ